MQKDIVNKIEFETKGTIRKKLENNSSIFLQ